MLIPPVCILGVIFTAATVGLLLTSLGAERFAKRRPQRTLIIVGFLLTIAGIGIFIVMAGSNSSPWAFVPGLFLIGLGLGLMLTLSVNVVQSRRHLCVRVPGARPGPDGSSHDDQPELGDCWSRGSGTVRGAPR